MNNFTGIWVLEQEGIVLIYLNTLGNYVIQISNTDFSLEEQQHWYLELIRNTQEQ